MTALKQYYEKHFLVLEFVASVFAACIFTLFLEFYIGRANFFSSVDENRPNLYAAVADITGSLLGFVISAVSVLLVFGSQLRFLKDSGQLPVIFNVFFQSIIWLAIATAWAFVGLLADTTGTSRIWILYVMLWLMGLAAMRVYRCVWILKKITLLATMENS
jgi:hypothetical protein